MNKISLLPFFFLLFSAPIAFGQTSHQYNWNIKLDLARFLYHYRSTEITVERRLSPKIGFVLAANHYYKLPEVKEKKILSIDKITATSNTNFRVSIGANFYNETTPHLFYRTRLSYGKIELQHRKHICLEKEIRNNVTVCTDFNEEILDRKMHQLMLRGGVVLQLPLGKHFFFDWYADAGLVHYFSKTTGQFRDDVNIKHIEKEYKQNNLTQNFYSDGALKTNISAPQVIFVFGLKLSYAF